MFERLFENVGAKLKGLAVGTFIVECIGSLIAALSIASNMDEGGFFVFLGILIGGCIAALFSAWILYGYGEMVENSSINEQRTQALLSVMLKSVQEEPVAEEPKKAEKPVAKEKPEEPAPVRKETKPKEAKVVAPVEAIIDGENKICPTCNTTQNKNRSVCWHCGQKFSN